MITPHAAVVITLGEWTIRLTGLRPVHINLWGSRRAVPRLRNGWLAATVTLVIDHLGWGKLERATLARCSRPEHTALHPDSTRGLLSFGKVLKEDHGSWEVG